MEDEKGDVGIVCSGGVSEIPVSVNLPSETLMENIGSEKQVEETYEEGDGGEIMVEVVGSDVFVDGVSGHKEGVLGEGEAGDLVGDVWENQRFRGAMEASNEGDENKVEESYVGRTASMNEPKHVISEKLEFSLNESADGGSGAMTELQLRRVGVLNDEVCNLGIEAKATLSSATTESMTGQSEEVMERTSVVVSEEMAIKDETVDKDSANIPTPELLNHPVEAVLEGEIDAVGKVETVHSSNNATSSLDLLDADSVMFHKAANAGAGGLGAHSELCLNSNCEGPDNAPVDEIEVVVEEVGLVHASAVYPIDHSKTDPSLSVALNSTISESDTPAPISVGGEVLVTGSSKGEVLWANAESVSTTGDGSIDVKVVNEKEVIAAGSEHLILKLEAVVSSVQDGNQGCGKDFDVIKCEVTDGIDVVSHTGVESIHEHCLASERGEVMGVDFDDTLDFKDGNLKSCANDNECLKTDGDIETDVVQLNHVFSNEPTQVASGVDTAEISEDEGLKIGIRPDKEDNQPNATSLSCAGDEEIVEAYSGGYANQSLIGTPIAEINAQKVAISQVKVVVGNGSPENGEEIDGGDIATACISDVATSNAEVNKSGEAEDNSGQNNGVLIVEGHTSETKPMDVEEEREFDQRYHGGKEVECREPVLETDKPASEEREFDQRYHRGKEVDCREPDLETDEPASETENSKLLIEEQVKFASSLRMNQSAYLSPPENEGQFSVSDLVWGKVRSYPWWPGQIFDPADASENAVKYYKKDSYLVAYFGDRTFAWNDASVLKPFRSHFSQIEKQSNSEAFQNAVNCALEEVSRRVELGLACSCIPKDAYDKIETQVVENTGIHEESSQRYGVDQSSRAASFEPDELLQYVRDLAPHASSGAHRLDLVIAEAQLSAFCCFKGYRLPTGFPSSGELLENDADTEQISDEIVASHKRKHTPKDSLLSRKERSLTELMGEVAYSSDGEDESVAKDPNRYATLSSGKKRKALDPLADGSDKRVSVYAAKVSTSTNQTPKPSFKIGECIRRVASQLTGSTSMVKGNNDETGIDGSPKIYEHSERRSMVVSAESSSLNEMLSQLQLVAQDPKKVHNFLNTIIMFFTGFRNSIALNRRGRRKKAVTAIGGSAEEFEFDDVNDSYWTDRIVQNYSEEQLLHNCENGAANLQVVPFDAEKSVKSGRKSHSRKRYSTGSYPTVAAELDENVKRRKQESSPAELILNFAERNCVPSEINLNKMFRRFGPLMESETEVDHDSGRAKVIFKRGSDAEVAHNSAEKFNIFGPVLVNYEIGYSPLISVKILPLALPQCQEDATLML